MRNPAEPITVAAFTTAVVELSSLLIIEVGSDAEHAVPTLRSSSKPYLLDL
jgi:hypothetical protein